MEIRGAPSGGKAFGWVQPHAVPMPCLPPSSLHRALGIPSDYGAQRGLKLPARSHASFHRPRGRRRPTHPPAPRATAAWRRMREPRRGRIVLLPFPVSQRAPADGKYPAQLPPRASRRRHPATRRRAGTASTTPAARSTSARRSATNSTRTLPAPPPSVGCDGARCEFIPSPLPAQQPARHCL